MKAVTATLLTVTALAAMSLPAFAQDEETAATGHRHHERGILRPREPGPGRL